MLSKKQKNIIIITSLVIFFFECLYMINIWFSDSKGFEWGSVSDWLNTAGTLGTLFVAYLAYKKVPEWMAQKHYDIAYGIIEKSIFDDLPRIRSSSFHLQTCISVVLNNLKKTAGTGIQTNITIIDIIDKIDDLAIKFQQDSNAIINQLNTVERIDYKLTETAKNTIALLTSVSENYFQIFEFIYALYEDINIEYSLEPEQRKKYTDTIDDMLKSAKENNKSITDHINLIYNGNKPITDFITPKKQKHT